MACNPNDGHRRQMWIGVIFVALSPLVLVPGADMLGFEFSPVLQWGLALFGLALGLRLLTWAMQRARSDEPAVAVDGRELRLHTHPGRRITLRRGDVLGVEPVQALEVSATGLPTGPTAFASSPAPAASGR